LPSEFSRFAYKARNQLTKKISGIFLIIKNLENFFPMKKLSLYSTQV